MQERRTEWRDQLATACSDRHAEATDGNQPQGSHRAPRREASPATLAASAAVFTTAAAAGPTITAASQRTEAIGVSSANSIFPSTSSEEREVVFSSTFFTERTEAGAIRWRDTQVGATTAANFTFPAASSKGREAVYSSRGQDHNCERQRQG